MFFKVYNFVILVLEMLQCARQCGRRNGAAPFLTFGEFCIFARELQRPKCERKSSQQRTNNSMQFSLSRWFILSKSIVVILECTKQCEVFLGGSCNPTTWRTDIAIPELQKHGISYYNPVSVTNSSILVSILIVVIILAKISMGTRVSGRRARC